MRRFLNGGLCPVVGLAWLFASQGIPDFIEARHSSGWPRCEGRIVASSVALVPEGETTRYAPSIRYRYRVAALAFEGHRIALERRTYGLRRAESEAAKYAVGRVVGVHYNPDRPAASMLEPGGEPIAALGAGVEGSLLLLSIALWWREAQTAGRPRVSPPMST